MDLEAAVWAFLRSEDGHKWAFYTLHSDQGREWHNKWLIDNPLPGEKTTDPESNSNYKIFFYFWWNDYRRNEMKKEMIKLEIRLPYSDERCYGHRLHFWGLPFDISRRHQFKRDLFDTGLRIHSQLYQYPGETVAIGYRANPRVQKSSTNYGTVHEVQQSPNTLAPGCLTHRQMQPAFGGVAPEYQFQKRRYSGHILHNGADACGDNIDGDAMHQPLHVSTCEPNSYSAFHNVITCLPIQTDCLIDGDSSSRVGEIDNDFAVDSANHLQASKRYPSEPSPLSKMAFSHSERLGGTAVQNPMHRTAIVSQMSGVAVARDLDNTPTTTRTHLNIAGPLSYHPVSPAAAMNTPSPSTPLAYDTIEQFALSNQPSALSPTIGNTSALWDNPFSTSEDFLLDRNAAISRTPTKAPYESVPRGGTYRDSVGNYSRPSTLTPLSVSSHYAEPNRQLSSRPWDTADIPSQSPYRSSTESGFTPALSYLSREVANE